MNLLSLDHHFCEGKIIGKMPELLNSYSSLFISLFSLHGIFINKLTNDGYIETLNTHTGPKGILTEHSKEYFIINKVNSKLPSIDYSISNLEGHIYP